MCYNMANKESVYNLFQYSKQFKMSNKTHKFCIQLNATFCVKAPVKNSPPVELI